MSRAVLSVAILLGIGAILLGIGAIANGIFMLLSPVDWYFAVPGVTTTGSFNQHFVRDIGLIFMGIGGFFLLGVMQPIYRTVLGRCCGLALRPRALPLLGSRGRYMRLVRTTSRLSCRDITSATGNRDHHPCLGGQRIPLMKRLSARLSNPRRAAFSLS